MEIADRRAEDGTFDIEVPGPLGIRYLPGRSERLVVSFSDIGGYRFRAPPPAFRSMASQEGRNHVLFVSDMSRSWLTADGMAGTLARIVRAAMEGIPGCRLSLIGNSMGGTMALHMSNLLPARSVLAIVPQFSAHPHVVPQETRWPLFRERLVPGRFERLDRIDAEDRLVAIMHGGDAEDRVHLDLFPRAAGLRHFVMPDGDHNMARRLKKEGHLDGIVRAAIFEQPYRFGQRARAAGLLPRSRVDGARPPADLRAA